MSNKAALSKALKSFFRTLFVAIIVAGALYGLAPHVADIVDPYDLYESPEP